MRLPYRTLRSAVLAVTITVTILVAAVTVTTAVITQLLAASLPYPASDRLWRVMTAGKSERTTDALLSPGAFLAWRQACPQCAVAAYQTPRDDTVFGPPADAKYIRMRHTR